MAPPRPRFAGAAVAALPLLLLLHPLAARPAAADPTACPFSPTASGLTGYYAGQLKPAVGTNAVLAANAVYLNGPNFAASPFLVTGVAQSAVTWTNVTVASSGSQPCQCSTYPGTPCVGPFAVASGVCNTPRGFVQSQDPTFNWYQYWYLTMTGSIKPPVTGYYTFYESSDDGMTMWVNGVLVAHQTGSGSTIPWPPQCSSSTGTKAILLQANTMYCVFINYYNQAGASGLVLQYEAKSASDGSGTTVLPLQFIPDAVFSPCAPSDAALCRPQQDTINCATSTLSSQLLATYYDSTNNGVIKREYVSSIDNSVNANVPLSTGVPADASAYVEYTGYLTTAANVGTNSLSPNSILLSNMYRLSFIIRGGTATIWLDDVQVFTATAGSTALTLNMPTPLPLVQTTSGSGYHLRVRFTRASNAAARVTLRWQPANSQLDTGNYNTGNLRCPGVSGYTEPAIFTTTGNTAAVVVPSSAFQVCAIPPTTPTPSATASYTQSATASFTQSATASYTQSATASFTQSDTASATQSATSTVTATPTPCATVTSVDPAVAQFGEPLQITAENLLLTEPATYECIFQSTLVYNLVVSSPASPIEDVDNLLLCDTPLGIYGPAELSLTTRITRTGATYTGCSSVSVTVTGPLGMFVYTGPLLTNATEGTLQSANKNCLLYTVTGTEPGFLTTSTADSINYCCGKLGVTNDNGGELVCSTAACQQPKNSPGYIFFEDSLMSPCLSNCQPLFDLTDPSPPIVESELQFQSQNLYPTTIGPATPVTPYSAQKLRDCYIETPDLVLKTGFALLTDEETPRDICCVHKGWVPTAATNQCNYGCPDGVFFSVVDDFAYDPADQSGPEDQDVCYVQCYSVTSTPLV